MSRIFLFIILILQQTVFATEKIKPILYLPIYGLNYLYTNPEDTNNQFKYDLSKIPDLSRYDHISIALLFIAKGEPCNINNIFINALFIDTPDFGFFLRNSNAASKIKIIQDITSTSAQFGVTLGGSINGDAKLSDPLVVCSAEELTILIEEINIKAFKNQLSFVDFDYENADSFNNPKESREVYSKISQTIHNIRSKYSNKIKFILTISAYSDIKWAKGYNPNSGLKEFVDNNLNNVDEFNFMLMHYAELYQNKTQAQMVKNMNDTVNTLDQKGNETFIDKIAVTYWFSEFGPDANANLGKFIQLTDSISESIGSDERITVNLFRTAFPQEDAQSYNGAELIEEINK